MSAIRYFESKPIVYYYPILIMYNFESLSHAAGYQIKQIYNHRIFQNFFYKAISNQDNKRLKHMDNNIT